MPTYRGIFDEDAFVSPYDLSDNDYSPLISPRQGPGVAPPDDYVYVSQRTYNTYGLYGGTYVDGPDDSVIRIRRRAALNAGVSRNLMYSSVDEVPATRRCDVCGCTLGVGINGDRCINCQHRATETARHIENGGRRFGIELEFVLPNADEYLDPEYDDYCEGEWCSCVNCRRERYRGSSRPDSLSAADIAYALTTAGVSCCVPGYTHEPMPQWKIVPDGSVSYGYELVSPPLQWSRSDEVRAACAVLRDLGCGPHRTCGLHVHHDTGDLTAKTAPILAKNWAACMPHTRRLVDQDRLYSEWCDTTQERSTNLQCNYEGATLQGFLELDYERYRALNWTCWSGYGTVEVRLHESTTDAEEILAWVAYTQSIVEASMAGRTVTTTETLPEALKQLTIRRAAGPIKTRKLLLDKAARH